MSNGIDFQNGLIVGMALTGKNGIAMGRGASPVISSAENLSFTVTELKFNKPLAPFDIFENLTAFMVLGEVYWEVTLFEVTDIEIVDEETIRLTHSTIANVDGTVIVAYSAQAGNIKGLNSVKMDSCIISYAADMEGQINIRKRIRITPFAITFDVNITMASLAESNVDLSLLTPVGGMIEETLTPVVLDDVSITMDSITGDVTNVILS